MRLEGWEGRLSAKLEEARSRPYDVGHWDCFRLACEVIAALTGRLSPWPEWEGRYTDERSAVDLLKVRGGFMQAFSDGFGSKPVSVKLARRGDICVYRDETRMRHLGICVGDKVAVLGPSGLAFVPISACLAAWRID